MLDLHGCNLCRPLPSPTAALAVDWRSPGLKENFQGHFTCTFHAVSSEDTFVSDSQTSFYFETLVNSRSLLDLFLAIASSKLHQLRVQAERDVEFLSAPGQSR